MGNTESNVASGVKKQTDASSILLYKLVDLKGGGLLVDMMKRATQTKQYAELDHALRTKVEPYLYNKGKGKWIPIEKLVLLRNKDRPKHKMLPPLRAMENPADYDIDKDMGEDEVDEAKIDKSKYRLVCWSLSERGAVGETILHLCMLHATAIHIDLAKRLLRFYPKLINDVYISDEYYGESALHIAIVNEDPSMVKFLLDSGADVHERCIGNFMCPEDQKASRTDSLDHEWVCVTPETNYNGYVYWGEYPLNFAACLGQEECYRLILARGADPDKQDTNGNTVLHMLVIYEKLATFDMAYEVGASLAIRNAQHLTPLTLSAKLAKIEMFFHILNIEREIYWQIGSITCAAYPLSQVDTIDVDTGSISHNSALNLVVFGEKDEHLELMDGILVDLLNAKWNNLTEECRLMHLDTLSTKIRLTAEVLMEIAATLYIFAALREARFLGLNMFIENLVRQSNDGDIYNEILTKEMIFLDDCTVQSNVSLFLLGFKTVGPFVVMIYRMIMGDLLRFVSIYLVFVMGFSQAYYIIFLSFDNPNTPEGVDDSMSNPMPSPIESIMAMFLMSMTNFGDYYGAFERTQHEIEAKFLFVVYMAIVAILLVNMLIAMMGNTYQKIAETRNEWQRQWARIVLVVERGVSPDERLKKLMDYSQPMSDGRRALVLRLNQSEEDKEEMKEILEMKRTHDKLYKKRQSKTMKKILTSEDNQLTIATIHDIDNDYLLP
ncbi:Transient receptor potential cation channel subfamily V member [Apis cerana cerana]|uniref:Transient receptor potential cation channel subfamily V member n=1 Tax=Apis cerana cerana TaxID=94128 RepID=A0A2A3EE00_APICC|nr:Transient receptor potential cation channel subfamily V member [Apis cerana cerana]